jgi:hypothetical protein
MDAPQIGAREGFMPRIYSVPAAFTLTNSGGNADLFELQPAAEKPIFIRGIILGQTSELGDIAEESVQISIIRLPNTFTSGNGTGVTPVPMGYTSAAAGFAAEYNGATVATTSGSAQTIFQFAWNIRQSPYEMWFPDDELAPSYQRIAGAVTGLVVRCDSTVADDVSIVATLIVEECG